MDVIVGTAGHIDHGKTALIKALTGIDADRLPEEKRRGITVDLGFAESMTGDVHFGFVDVPGHERFVKNMLAGVSGIDIVMLVIAADEGVMPQTREHFDICRLLGIRSGIVVLTKTDLAEADVLELAKMEAAELVAGSFLDKAPVIEVSSRTGRGVDELKAALVAATLRLPKKIDRTVMRLPIDRSFSVKGFGTVVTGTLSSSSISEGAELAISPDGDLVRARGLQTHGRSAAEVTAGQRVAVNLGGIDHSSVIRGMVLTERDVLRPTQILDARVEVLAGAAKPLRTRQRLRIHIGTVEALARVQVLNAEGSVAPGKKDLIQIRIEVPVTAVPGERFIARSYSPQITIAGGIVIDTFAAKHRRKDIEASRMQLLALMSAHDELAQTVFLHISGAGGAGLSYSELQARTGLRREFLSDAIDAGVTGRKIVAAGERYITRQDLDRLCTSALTIIGEFHKQERLAKGISRDALAAKGFKHLPPEIFHTSLAELQEKCLVIAEREIIRLASHHTDLPPAEAELGRKILAKYEQLGLEVTKLGDALAETTAGTAFAPKDVRRVFQTFVESGEIVKVTDEFYFAKGIITKLIGDLRGFAASSGDRLIDVSKFKDIAGVSRKYAIPLLEYFDRERITRRAGDRRLIL